MFTRTHFFRIQWRVREKWVSKGNSLKTTSRDIVAFYLALTAEQRPPRNEHQILVFRYLCSSLQLHSNKQCDAMERWYLNSKWLCCIRYLSQQLSDPKTILLCDINHYLGIIPQLRNIKIANDCCNASHHKCVWEVVTPQRHWLCSTKS